MPSKAKGKKAAAKKPAAKKVSKSIDEQVGRPLADLNKPDQEVILISDPDTEAAVSGEKTVVYKDWNGDWDFAHLNADGEAWIHSPQAEEPFEGKAAAIAAAGLAYPAWPVEVVDENPWNVKAEPESAEA